MSNCTYDYVKPRKLKGIDDDNNINQVLELNQTKGFDLKECDLGNLNVTYVVPKTSATDSIVFFGKLQGVPAAFKVSLWNKRIFQNKRNPYIPGLEYERMIYQRFVNNIIRQKVSPNFVAYLTTFVCDKEQFYRNNRLGLLNKHTPWSSSAKCNNSFFPNKKDHRRGGWGIRSAAQKKLQREKLFNWQLCKLEYFWRLDNRIPADCVNMLVLEGLNKPVSSDDMFTSSAGLRINRDTAESYLLQILYVFSVLDYYRLNHYDAHPGNVLIEHDTSSYGSLHKHNVIYVLDENHIFSLPVNNKLVKLFDWDWGYNNEIGRNRKIQCSKTRNPRGFQCSKFSEYWDTAHHLVTLYSWGEEMSKRLKKPSTMNQLILQMLDVPKSKMHEISAQWAFGPQVTKHFPPKKPVAARFDWSNWLYKNNFNPSNLMKHPLFMSKYQLQRGEQIHRGNIYFHPSLTNAQRNNMLLYKLGKNVSNQPQRSRPARVINFDDPSIIKRSALKGNEDEPRQKIQSLDFSKLDSNLHQFVSKKKQQEKPVVPARRGTVKLRKLDAKNALKLLFK